MTDRFCAGPSLDFVVQGISELPSSEKNSAASYSPIIKNEYGVSVSRETADVLSRLTSISDIKSLASAVRDAGLNDDEISNKIPEDVMDETVDVVDDPGLAEAIRQLDTTVELCPRSLDASKCTTKQNREYKYVPDVHNDAGNGDVYMAKTLSSPSKVRMAWDLNDSNQVVLVDNYELWENLLGWKKLKSFPHGKNKIIEELGHKLSDDVLEQVIGQSESPDTSDDDDSGSRGRSTRTKPSEELLNLATSSRRRGRTKMRSKKIAECLEDDGSVNSIQQIVLFPTTTDLNMTDHWWVAGKRWLDGGACAIANCNKGTFEYLNQYEQVWHIEDYLDQAWDYEFETSAGPVNMNVVAESNVVFHTVTKQTKNLMLRDRIVENVTEALTEYVENEVRRDPPLPHQDDMIYAPLSVEDVFWLRPVLMQQTDPSGSDAVILTADEKPRDLPTTYGVSSDYKLYARARLPNWDFSESVELKRLDKGSYYFDLDDGGYEMLETLGKLHDNGEQPFSQTPETRWHNAV